MPGSPEVATSITPPEVRVGSGEWRGREGRSILENEFNPDKPVSILKPLPLKAENFSGMTPSQLREVSEILETDFEYYSRTKDLEVDTERTSILHGVVNRMVQGAGIDIQTRVVIMKKEGVNAFVSPDGTVFVSQSLLNKLDTLDEVAAVLGHEVGHLIHKSYVRKAYSSDSATQLGVSWAHESACDYEGRRLPEVGGFNSLAFASMIEKVQGMERGMEHQSGLTRASTSIGSHFFIDSRTSHIDQTPMPDILRGEFKRTNLQVIGEKLKKAELSEIRPMLEQLHPKDLEKVYVHLWSERGKSTPQAPNRYERYQEVNNLILERLTQAGYSLEDSALFLLSHPNTGRFGVKEDSYILNPPEKLQALLDAVGQFENSPIRTQMHKLIFSTKSDGSSPLIRIMDMINDHMFIQGLVEGNAVGISFDQLSLLNTLQKINNTHSVSSQEKPKKMADIINTYIYSAFVSPTIGNKQPLDIEGVRKFLTELQTRGIFFDSQTFINRYYHTPARRELYDKDGRDQSILEAYKEIFNVKIEEGFDFEEIDSLFERVKELQGHPERLGYLDDMLGRDFNILLKHIQKYFDDFGVTKDKTEDRLRFINYISGKIDGLALPTEISMLKFLAEGKRNRDTRVIAPLKDGSENYPEQIDSAILNFNMKVVVARALFGQDNEQFYQYIYNNMMQLQQSLGAAGFGVDQFSKVQLLNLCQGLLTTEYRGRDLLAYGYSGTNLVSDIDLVSIEDDSLFKLPLLAEVANRKEEIGATNIRELITYTKSYLPNLHHSRFGNTYSSGISLYSDEPLGLIIGPAITREFNQLISKGVPDKELDDVYEFVNLYFSSGVQKDEILRNVRRKYLRSPEVSLDEKVNYLVRFSDSVGYEGVLTVVSEIRDINTYRDFRSKMTRVIDRYLEGSVTITAAAHVDIVSAEVVNQFERLLQTAQDDPDTIAQVSNELAQKWMSTVTQGTRYDSENQRFVLGEKARESFRTVADSFTTLKNLSSLQKFAIAHKALMEKDGAFTSAANREKLANVLVAALGLEPGFISQTLSTGVKEGDIKYIAYPASNMLASLLFRALDLNAINVDTLAEQTVYYNGSYVKVESIIPKDQLTHILEAETRNVVLFGASARKDPNSQLAHMADDSDSLFYESLERLQALTSSDRSVSAEQINPKGDEIDMRDEAVIRAVETSALGIRSLQLASQFLTFSESVNRRLSETFDSNPGMDRLMFWENLNNLAQRDTAVEAFLQRIKLGEYLGGGSLQTTYGATLTEEDGSERKVIVKRKNPNVVALIKAAYNTSRNVLEKVEQEGNLESKQYARTSMLLLDLAQAWCIADINDTEYEQNDDLFRQTVDKFNASGKGGKFYAPQRIFTDMSVKSEDLADGKTVNQVLKDDRISSDAKKDIVTRMGRFFIFQLRGNSFADSDGKKFFLVHSDPHVGNYMVDPTQPNPAVGVIDRSLYLKLDERDVKVMEKLVGDSNPNDFVYSFIDRVLDQNKVRGRFDRLRITAGVFTNLAKEFTSQLVRGRVDKLTLMRTLMAELSNRGMDIPLNLRLMIRNVGALQELTSRYGVSLQQLSKESV